MRKNLEVFIHKLSKARWSNATATQLGVPFLRRTTKTLSKIVLGLSSTTIICGLVIWTWSDFADARNDAKALISAAAMGTDHLGRRSLRSIDDVLKSMVASIEKRGLDQIGPEWEKEHLAAFARRLPESAELLVADKHGTVIAAVPSLSSTVNVRLREWFSTLKEHEAELAVGRAVRGRGFHDLIFPVDQTEPS